MPLDTITHRLINCKERPPERTALHFKRHKTWLTLNWQDYYRRIELAAQLLHNLGVQKQDRVAILSNSRLEWAVSDFAILGIGAVTVPIYQSIRANEIEHIINDSQAKVLILEDFTQWRKWESISKRCPSVQSVIVIDDHEDIGGSALRWETKLAELTPEIDFAKMCKTVQLSDLATLVYTSGTTGEPKGVELTHLQIVSELDAVAQVFPISHEDSTLSFLPYAHVLGRVEIWLHVSLGFELHFAESIERLTRNLKEAKPTVIIAVPRIFEKMYSGLITEIERRPLLNQSLEYLDSWTPRFLKPVRDLAYNVLIFGRLREAFGGRLRFAVSGGAPLEPKISDFFKRAGIPLLEGYGLTETTAAITTNTPQSHRTGTVGKPLPGVEIRLSEDGEILVRSDMVTPRYHNSSEEDLAKFNDGFFSTGDIGEWTEDGFLRITDRKKDLIKTSGGKYVAPQKLESLLKLDPLISNALIYGDKQKYIVALITLDEARAKQLAKDNMWPYRDFRSLTHLPAIHALVRQSVATVNAQLSNFESIKSFAILDHDFSLEKGELTPSLKLKRRVISESNREIIAMLYT